MATDKPRFSITVSNELYDGICDYQHTNRIQNQSKAINELIQKGFSSLSQTVPAENNIPCDGISESEMDLILAYRQADPKARAIVDIALSEYKKKAGFEEPAV